LHKRYTFSIICIIAAVLFAVSAAVHWHKTHDRVNRRVQEHSKVVSHSVWNLNEKNSESYLEIVAKHNNYSSIRILDAQGNVFALAETPVRSRMDSFLMALHLIPEVSFSSPIVYNDQILGQIEVVWRNTIIYTFFYAFLITGLLLSTVYMYLRLLDSNKNLEDKIRFRTKTLRENEQKFRALFDNHYQLTGLISPDGILLSANQASLDIIDCTEEEVVGTSFCECPWWPPGSALHDEIKVLVHEAQEGKFVRTELQFRDRNEGERIIDFSLKPVFNEKNKLIYIIPEGRDVTSLKQAQKEKIREQLFTEAVIESLPGIFYICNENLELLRWNKSLETTSGFAADELLHKSLFSFFLEKDWEIIRKRIIDRIQNIADAPIELYAINREGKRMPFLFSSSILDIDGTRYLIGTGVDISDRKKIEMELQQARKMEAIGTLAGGIAHDFNNILSAIIGYTELSQLEILPDSRAAGFLAGIHQAAIRARDLVRQILIFSRKQDNSLLPVEIAPVVNEALRLIRSSVPSSITIKTDIRATGARIKGDPTRIHQMTLNLCTNAYQAIGEDPGTMQVSLRRVNIAADNRDPESGQTAGRFVRLQVCDDGPGMDRKTQERIFEPYFTTKDMGKGTGLGLALVDSIVKEHNGRITVDSSTDSGTRFNVYLPLLDDAGMKTTRTIIHEPTANSGNRHIVCIDDEPYILNIMKEFLQDRKHRVTLFENAEEALAFVLDRGNDIDLVITDMTMPGLTGLELGRRIFNERPGLPVILCTGYSRTVNREQALQEGFAAYLDKPIILTDLEATVHAVHDEG
jgi:PAS domain S-box-containing protein